MRRLLAALGLIGLLSPAFAADYELPTLRGSQMFVPAYPTYFSWQGFYVGGQVGYANSGIDFGNGVSPLIDITLRNTRVNQDLNISRLTVLGKRDTNGSGVGGFIGYNWQYDQAVVGLEMNYSRMSVGATASDSIARVFPDPKVSANYVYDVAVTGQSAIHITDLATLRGRAGYVMGNFMPYGFLGLAVGRADISSSASVAFCGFDPTVIPPASPTPDPIVGGVPCYNASTGTPTLITQPATTQSKTGEFFAGVAAGAGVDVAVSRNVFLRGEYEYVQITTIQSLHVYLNNFRLGLGAKF
jgi:outer membrane immunogenic protein